MKTVLITGASSGLGKSLALLYAEQGWRVIACGRSEQRLAQLAQLNTNIETLSFDITSKADVLKAAEPLTKIDMVVLNAGDCEYIDDAVQFDSDLFSRVIHTNLIATGYLLEALVSKITKGGRLVFVSSSVVYLPFTRAQAYGASKAGLDYLAATMRLDLQPQGIHVSTVRPGFVKTPLTDKNDFSMPFLVEPDAAAKRVFSGLEKGKATIEFPRRFIIILKLVNILLPKKWWNALNNRNIK